MKHGLTPVAPGASDPLVEQNSSVREAGRFLASKSPGCRRAPRGAGSCAQRPREGRIFLGAKIRNPPRSHLPSRFTQPTEPTRFSCSLIMLRVLAWCLAGFPRGLNMRHTRVLLRSHCNGSHGITANEGPRGGYGYLCYGSESVQHDYVKLG